MSKLWLNHHLRENYSFNFSKQTLNHFSREQCDIQYITLRLHRLLCILLRSFGYNLKQSLRVCVMSVGWFSRHPTPAVVLILIKNSAVTLTVYMVTRQEFHRQWKFKQPGLWERSEDIKQDKNRTKEHIYSSQGRRSMNQTTIIKTLSFSFPPKCNLLIRFITLKDHLSKLHDSDSS